MLIALTGLHKSGKSYFANAIPPKYGFITVNKKKIIEQLCFEKTERTDWNAWHAEEFNKDAQAITQEILERIPEGDVVLDAVHSNLEWEIIKELYPDAVLAVVVTMEKDRINRWSLKDNMNAQNAKRIGFWHNPSAENQCLLSYASWSFNGSDTLENMENSFSRLVQVLKQDDNSHINVKQLIKRMEESDYDNSKSGYYIG